MARGTDAAVLLDSLAQALILVDPADGGTFEEVRAALSRLAAWAKRRGVARDQIDAFAEVALRLQPGTELEAVLEDLEARFAAIQAAVTASRLETAGKRTAARPAKRAPAAEAAPATAAAAESTQAPSTAEPSTATPLAGDAELLRDFVARAAEYLDAADEQMLVLEKDPTDAEALNAVFRAFHTIKGMAGFLALGEIEQLSHDTESVLDRRGKEAKPLDPDVFDRVFAAIDEMKGHVARVLPGAEPSKTAVAAKAAVRADLAAAKEPETPRPQTANSVRVDEERLDRLLDTIGELVIAESMFSETAKTSGDVGVLGVQLSRLDKITRELQAMATTLRMVPLRSTFARMGRLVRDVSHKAGKTIEFVTEGGDTELDKLVVDRIYDPLVHILRNAVDHGIESGKERRAAGKSEAGRIELRAYHGGGAIHVDVSDDGRGFDMQAIVAAARKRGLIGEGEEPGEREARDLAFAPGLSTAATVTDVSGRGVGMDVVRRAVEALRGEIDIKTTPGGGTQVNIRLPLTLAIIDGMVVRVGDERYIIPLLSIERSVRPDRGQLSGVLGAAQMLSIGDSLVPLVHLGGLFKSAGTVTDPTEGIVVIVSEGGERVGLVACEILGQQQIVIKSLGDGMHDAQGVSGAAIMPDGRVGLIVDVGGLVRLSRTEVREVAS